MKKTDSLTSEQEKEACFGLELSTDISVHGKSPIITEQGTGGNKVVLNQGNSWRVLLICPVFPHLMHNFCKTHVNVAN
uniref:Uncharacterized protein n=1 Tax=Physcomitrium patens TaxID=3218 RepID=A0A2K1JBV6_PHYPA|nr:hypothetical protein PHYPA_019269 [Physcomitrium patens]